MPKICKGELILWTHVTSPFFNHLSYIKFIKKFLENKKNFDSAFTASVISSFIYNKSKKKWLSHNKFINKWPRTQDLDKIYSLNNAAFISKREIYTKLKDRIGNKPFPYESYENIDEIFDIDNKKDFKSFQKKFTNKI